MLGKRTVVMENNNQSFEGGFILSPKGSSRSITYQARELLTPDEVLRLRGPEKRGSDIVKAGDMLVLVAGFAPIYGQQILYFKDPVFLERAKIPPPMQGDITSYPKNYKEIFGEHGGVLTVEVRDEDILPNLDELVGDEDKRPTVSAAEGATKAADTSESEATASEGTAAENSGESALDAAAAEVRQAMEALRGC
jgi:type IV secretion system protein VirD4